MIMIKRLFEFMKESKLLLIASLVCAIISVLSSLFAPLIIGEAIDNMISKNNVNFEIVIKMIIILAIVYAAGLIFTWLLNYLTNSIVYKTANIIRERLFQKLNRLKLEFFDKKSHGDTISRFINDVDAITDGMIQGLSTLISGVMTIIFAISFMIWLNSFMAVVVILSAPFTYIVARVITKKSHKYFKAQASMVGGLNGYIEEIITGQKTVKAFNREEKILEKFKKINKELYYVGRKAQFLGAIANPSTRLVNNIAYSIIGVTGSILALRGSLSVGQISSFLIYATLFSKPFNEITGVLTQIQGAIASSERIFEMLDIPEESKSEDNSIEINQFKGEIEFKDVAFSYEKEIEFIKNFNVKIVSGSRVAIVGKTGCGKTTLVNLLMRFYDVNKGAITIDGIDIRKINLDNLRKNFGMVLQDTFLFADTIANNIAYGRMDATLEEIKEAAKFTGAHSFIKRLPKGYDTVLSASGDSLSQGQRQLLTITRIMIVDPPMLILDEATSNIDTRLELHIQKAFQKIMKGRTSFIIAHRLSTIKEADKILVVDKGNIVEQGTHMELLKLKGYYANLYNSQFQK